MIIEHGPCEYCGKPLIQRIGEDASHYRRRKSCSTKCGNRLRAAGPALAQQRKVSEDIIARVFGHLCLAAQSGSFCPTNLSIAGAVECSSSEVSEGLRVLRGRGRIVTTFGVRRQITIISGPLAGLVLVTAPRSAPPRKRLRRPPPAILIDDDLMNYGQGFGPDIDPGDGVPMRPTKPDDGLALSVAGRYL